MKDNFWLLAPVVVGCAQVAFTADPALEDFCDPVAWPDVCQDDQLNIRFLVGDSKVSELTEVTRDQVIPVQITINTVTAGISGFSYGVKHDTAILSIPQPDPTDPTCDRGGNGTGDLSGCNPTISGTTTLVEQADLSGWNTTELADGAKGFYSAVIFSLFRRMELPIDQVDYPICNVKYVCVTEPTSAGSKIYFTDELNPVNSPPVSVNLTTNGKSKRPKTVQNAIVKGRGVEKFFRGDANGDSKVNVTDGVIIAQDIFTEKPVFFNCDDMLDANDDGQLNTLDPVYLLQYIFLKGQVPASPFKTCDVDPTADSLSCSVPNCQ